MRIGLGMCGAALLGLLTTAAVVRADEEKISADKLPAAVKRAVQKKFPEAKIRGAAKEVEDGKTTYEVMLTDDGRAVDLAMKADGTILEMEKEIAVSKLPKAVARAVAAKYPNAKIEKAEELIQGEDGPTRYEVVVNGKEVVLTAKGQIVEPKEKDEDDDKPKSGKKSKKQDKEEDDD